MFLTINQSSQNQLQSQSIDAPTAKSLLAFSTPVLSVRNWQIMLKALGLVTTVLVAIPAIAHNVEISNEVAATFHITPDHNPQVGKPAQAWFALTRRGGQTIPLSECNCGLNIYRIPRNDGDEPILKPELSAINVEKYREIPGAKIIFPQAGAYELELVGTAKDSTSFSPFELSYTVNVRP